MLGECGVGNVLDGKVLFQSDDGGGPGGLAENHEGPFEADGSVSGVAGGESGGDEEVGGVRAFRDDGAVGDAEGFVVIVIDVGTFVVNFSIDGEGAGVVVIDGPPADADGICDGWGGLEAAFGALDDVGLSDDVVGDHAAGAADVEHPGPAAVVDEFVGAEAPFGPLGAECIRNGGIGGEVIDETLGETAVLFVDGLAFGVGAGGVSMVAANEVSREVVPAPEVEEFEIRVVVYPAGAVEPVVSPAGGEVAAVEFVIGDIVVVGGGDGNFFVGVFREW